MAITVKNHWKVDIKLFLYCPIWLDLSVLFQICCLNLQFNKLLNKLVKIFQILLTLRNQIVWFFIFFPKLTFQIDFVPWIPKKAPTYMFDWVLNTYTPEVDNKDTRTTSFMLFLCFYCWLWTSLVHWFSCTFDIFYKLMFPLF